MSYEIVVADKNTGISSDCTIVSGRANKARYAVAALKSQMSNLLGNGTNTSKTAKDLKINSPQINHTRSEDKISKPQPEPLVKKRFLQAYLPKWFSRKETLTQQAVLGVDITPSCIYVCQVNNNGGNNALTGLASVCMEGKFLSEDILSNPNLYSESLKKLIAENKITAKKVAVSLPVSSSIVRVATISKMDDRDIARAIKFGSLWQNLMGSDHSPDNYSIFYQVIRREKTSDTMDILLVATKLSDINLYSNIVKESGLEPIIIDAKSIALNSAIKNRPNQNTKYGTILIEFGLENNHIMVMGGAAPRVFSMEVSDAERAAILGLRANGNEEIVDALITRYHDKLRNILSSYRAIKPFIAIEDIYVMSSLPLIGEFITKLGASLSDCKVRECNMFDFVIVPDDFTISKTSANNNISAWASALGTAVMPWRRNREEWIEIRKSPTQGVKYFRHYSKLWNSSELSVKIGNSNQHAMLDACNKSTLARLAYPPTFAALGAIVLAGFLMMHSYRNLVTEGLRLDQEKATFAEIASIHEAKTNEIAEKQGIIEKMAELDSIAIDIAKDDNQKYLLSMYNYMDNVLQPGVWLKQMNFTAPNNLEIEGRSVDDKGVISFLGILSNSEAFSQMALKHMQSINEMDLFSSRPVALKSFIFKGSVAENLSVEYQHKNNLIASGVGHSE